MNTKIAIDRLRLSFGTNEVLKNITINVYKNTITGFMGPSGSGKSTLISVINKMIDFEDNVKIHGKVSIDGKDILENSSNPVSPEKTRGDRLRGTDTSAALNI